MTGGHHRRPAGRNCWSDEQTAAVCNSGDYLQPSAEIFGIDDTTGKKVLGLHLDVR